MQRLMSRSAFARLAGVNPSTITRLTKTCLKRAMVGKQIDAAHAAAVVYLSKQDRPCGVHPPPDPAPEKPRGNAAVREAKKSAPAPFADADEIPEEMEAFADYTLRQLIHKFGTDGRFVDWLSAMQKIEAINEKRLKNAQTRGDLVSRDMVQRGVIDTFNSAHLRLMADGAKSIAAGVIAKHASGAAGPEVEAYVSDILGSFIKPVKAKVGREVKKWMN